MHTPVRQFIENTRGDMTRTRRIDDYYPTQTLLDILDIVFTACIPCDDRLVAQR